MARLRSIKPGFFKNELLAEVPPVGRLLFAGMWGIADREGRLEDRPKRIKAEVMPYDNFDAEAMVAQLASLGFLLRYEVDGARYLQIVNWDKHQQPHMHEAESTIQAPYMHGASTVLTPDKHESSTGHARLELGSLTRTKSKEIEGTKERGVARAKGQTPTPILRAVPKPKATATTLQEDFVITPDMRAWAAQNVPTVDVESATSAWLDYCRAKQPRYSDWLAAWRNGMRKAAEWQSQGSGGTRNGANQGRRLSKGERNNAFWQQYQLEREGIRNQGADRNIVPGASPPDTGRY